MIVEGIPHGSCANAWEVPPRVLTLDWDFPSPKKPNPNPNPRLCLDVVWGLTCLCGHGDHLDTTKESAKIKMYQKKVPIDS